MGNKKYEIMQSVRRWEIGMVTIEASFIIPIILFVAILVIYGFFYGLEMAVAAGTIREEITKAADNVKTDGTYETGAYSVEELNNRSMLYLLSYSGNQTETKLKKAIKKKLSQRSLFGNKTNVKVDVGILEVEATVTSKIPIPLAAATEIGGIKAFEINHTGIAMIRIPAERMRRVDSIE